MCPLRSRAWVYQGRRLSPSFVHLAKEQLYWECKTCLISEDRNESYSHDRPGDVFHGYKIDGRKQTSFSLGSDLNVVRDAINNTDQRVDFDYRTAEPPILAGQKLALLLLTNCEPLIQWTGIVLRSIEPQIFERVGHMRLRAYGLPPGPIQKEQKKRLKRPSKFVDSLPQKQFEIL